MIAYVRYLFAGTLRPLLFTLGIVIGMTAVYLWSQL